MPLSPLPLEVRIAKPGQRQGRQHRHALPGAQTWLGSWKLRQSHRVLVVTWSFYFGGVSLVLAMQLPFCVPFMQVTLLLVPNWVHSCISSISARGLQVGYHYHYPVPPSLHGVTGHFVALQSKISSIKQKFGTLTLQRTGGIMIAEILVLQTHFLTVPQS